MAPPLTHCNILSCSFRKPEASAFSATRTELAAPLRRRSAAHRKWILPGWNAAASVMTVQSTVSCLANDEEACENAFAQHHEARLPENPCFWMFINGQQLACQCAAARRANRSGSVCEMPRAQFRTRVLHKHVTSCFSNTAPLFSRLFSLPGWLGQADGEGRKARPDSVLAACYAWALLAGQFGLASQEGAEAEQEEEGARSPCVFLIDKQPFVSAPSKHVELGPLRITQ